MNSKESLYARACICIHLTRCLSCWRAPQYCTWTYELSGAMAHFATKPWWANTVRYVLCTVVQICANGYTTRTRPFYFTWVRFTVPVLVPVRYNKVNAIPYRYKYSIHTGTYTSAGTVVSRWHSGIWVQEALQVALNCITVLPYCNRGWKPLESIRLRPPACSAREKYSKIHYNTLLIFIYHIFWCHITKFSQNEGTLKKYGLKILIRFFPFYYSYEYEYR